MEIDRELLGKIPDEVLIVLHRRASGDLVDLFEEEILARMGKSRQSKNRADLRPTKTSPAIPENRKVSALLGKLGGKKRKRKMSAAGRKAISDATKRRWAEFHRQKAAAEKAASAKKTGAKKKK